MVYPHSETANLNAANAAMSVGDIKKAERYLSKSGYTPEAVYARGVHAGLSRQYAQAKSLFEQARKVAVQAGNTTVAEAATDAIADMNEFIL